MLSNNSFDRVYNYAMQAITLITLMLLTLGPKRVEYFAKRMANTQITLWTLVGNIAELLLMSDYVDNLLNRGMILYCLWTKNLCLSRGEMTDKTRSDLHKQIRDIVKKIRKYEKKYGA